MSQSPRYYSNYTLKNFIAEKVIKAQEADTTPPPPSQKDYIRAFRKDPLVNIGADLSVNAPPFYPQAASSISVTSFLSSCQPLLVPVQYCSGRLELPVSTLQLFFPLVTGLHYISGNQLVTLAKSSSYTVNQGRLELSHQVFCIPYAGSDVTYVVTNKNDVVIGNNETVIGISNMIYTETEFKESVNEFDSMKSFRRLALMEDSMELQVTDGFAEVESNARDQMNELSKQLLLEDSSNIYTGACAAKENLNYVDDYGFSDPEEDLVSEIQPKKLIKSEKDSASIAERTGQVKCITFNRSSATEKTSNPVSVKNLEGISSSPKPRCFSRILPSKPVVVSLL